MSDDEAAASSLGERLLAAVRNLWNEASSQQKVLNHHGQEFEAIKVRLDKLEREVQGLKVSRGKARAKSARLSAMLQEADGKLSDVRELLN